MARAALRTRKRNSNAYAPQRSHATMNPRPVPVGSHASLGTLDSAGREAFAEPAGSAAQLFFGLIEILLRARRLCGEVVRDPDRSRIAALAQRL